MPVKVKICGITNVPDALAAVEAGADMLGFVFYEQSPRCVSIRAAAEIIAALPEEIIKAGVFVNAPAEVVSETISRCDLNYLQLHGDESPDDCLRFGRFSIKAFRIRDAASLGPLPAYKTDAWLLDAHSANGVGGTGQKFNWDLA